VRESCERGISVEGDFAFTKAVGNFCKKAGHEGKFLGNYKFNLKEQMKQRAKGDVKKGKNEALRFC
jgi:hypothetical protein